MQATTPNPSAPSVALPTDAGSLLDAVLSATVSRGPTPAGRVPPPRDAGAESWLAEFLASKDLRSSLALWMAKRPVPAADRAAVANALAADIAAIDALISAQVNAILHHPAFQKLEASWRGLWHMVQHTDPEQAVTAAVLNVSWKEVTRDLDNAAEFDQSELFRKIYSDRFDTPGGHPFGLIVGDYSISHRISPEHPDDITTLEKLSHVAAAAFSPFIANASPELLGAESFADVARAQNLPGVFESLDYLKWRAFRDSEDSRFVGLTVPRMLMRTPYGGNTLRHDGFAFAEEASSPEHYCWGNPAYAFAGVVAASVAATGWMTDIRGFTRDLGGGGLVTGLVEPQFSTDAAGTIHVFPTDVAVTDTRERELADLGFIPLCHSKDSPNCVFFSNPSLQKPKKYDKPAATLNARLSSMLQYMLCASRFAHYLKALSREKVGSFASADDVQRTLRTWVNQFSANDTSASDATRAKYPLREAQVEVFDSPGKPGAYQCIMHLLPHSQLDAMSMAIRLATEIRAVSG